VSVAFYIVMLSVITPSVAFYIVMLSVITLSVAFYIVMLSVITPCVAFYIVMLSGIMPRVGMLNVVALILRKDGLFLERDSLLYSLRNTVWCQFINIFKA
jgi:hypothetical protein